MKFLALACLALYASVASAGRKSDMDGIEREYKFETKDREVRLVSKTKDKEERAEDELDFQINLQKHGIFSQFEYKAKNKGEKGSQDNYAVKSKLQVKVFKIFEWVDTDKDGEFDPKDDIVASSMYVRGKGDNWKNIKSQKVKLSGDDAKTAQEGIEKFELTNSDGTFGVVGRYSGVPVTFNEVIVDNRTVVNYELNANAVKFDMWLKDYNSTAPTRRSPWRCASRARARSAAKRTPRSSFKRGMTLPRNPRSSTGCPLSCATA